MIANNQYDIANYQTLEELEEESTTDPIIQQKSNITQQDSYITSASTSGIYSTLSQDSDPPTTPLTPGMYRQVKIFVQISLLR